MNLEIRSEDGSGKHLFSWDPEYDTIDIVQKDFIYRVKLLKQDKLGTYRVLDKKFKTKKL